MVSVSSTLPTRPVKGKKITVATLNDTVSVSSKRKKKNRDNMNMKIVYGSPVKFQDIRTSSSLSHKKRKAYIPSKNILGSPIALDFKERPKTSMERICQSEEWKLSIEESKNRFQGRNTSRALACWKRWSKPGEMKVFNTDFNYVRAVHPHPLVLRFKKNPAPELNPAVRSYFDTEGPNITMSIGRKNVNVEMQVCKEEERLGITPNMMAHRKAWLSDPWANYIAKVNDDFHFSKKDFFDKNDRSLARTIGLTNSRLERVIPTGHLRPATSHGFGLKREQRWNSRHHVNSRHINGSAVCAWEVKPRFLRELNHCKSTSEISNTASIYGTPPATPKKSPSKRHKLKCEMSKVYKKMLASQ